MISHLSTFESFKSLYSSSKLNKNKECNKNWAKLKLKLIVIRDNRYKNLANECLSNQRSPFEGCFALFILNSPLNKGASPFLKSEVLTNELIHPPEG